MITVAIPVIGNKPLLDKCVKLLSENSRSGFHIIVIDNGSKEPMRHEAVGLNLRNEENIGMVQSLKQAMEYCTTEILLYMHSDMFIYEKEWDWLLQAMFDSDPKLGLIGVVGARNAEADGGRSDVLCSFRDGHVHGQKTPPAQLHPVALLDGCFMAFRMEAALDAKIPDEDFNTHHFYDKDWSLSVLMRGWKVGVIPLDCEHLGGQTSCRPEYNEWAEKKGGDIAIYKENEQRYLSKWKDHFPVRVEPSGVVHVGRK